MARFSVEDIRGLLFGIGQEGKKGSLGLLFWGVAALAARNTEFRGIVN